MLILAQMKRVGAEGRMGACLRYDRNRAIGASLSCETLSGSDCGVLCLGNELGLAGYPRQALHLQRCGRTGHGVSSHRISSHLTVPFTQTFGLS